MPRYHTVYVTKLGVPFIEEAQEYESEVAALSAAVEVFTPTPDADGKLHYAPVLVKTHDGDLVLLPDFDHITTMTPEKLNGIKKEEARQQAQAQGYHFTEDDDS